MKKEILQVNGIHLCVQESGQGNDLILIHGKGYSKENMNILFDHFQNQYHVVSYDVRGHGESDKPSHFTLEDDVQDLVSLISVMNLKKPSVIGFSMGSYIALKTAEEYPDLFSRIILIGPKGGGAASSTQQIQEQAEKEGLSQKERLERMLHKVFAPKTAMADIQAFDRSIASPVQLTPEQQKTITESLQNFDLMQDAHKVNVPVLVLTGQYDGINPPEEGRKVAEALPQGRFEMIPDAGHIAFFENRECVISFIDTFLK